MAPRAGAADAASFSSFENPASEAAEAAADAADGDVSPTSRSEDSPRSPVVDEFGRFDDEPFESEVWDERTGRRQARKTVSHLVLLVGTLLLLPAFLLFALFMLWVAYLQTNPVNILIVCVALVIPAVLYIGYRGAAKQSEPALRGYSFALLLVITMQLSMVLVTFLDEDGTLAEAYVESCVLGFDEICGNLQDPPVGVDWLSIDTLCGCASAAVNAEDNSRNYTDATEDQSNAASLSCIREVILEKATGLMGGTVRMSAVFIGLGVIMIESLLSFLAYGMIVDLDLKEAQKAAKLEGGAPTGYIRGNIVGGLDLRTKEMNVLECEDQKKKTTTWRRKKPAKYFSCLFVDMVLKTPGLHKSRKHHLLQRVTTEGVEDDCFPMFNTAFEQLVTYAGSRQLEITVYDQQSKQSKELVGSATVVVKGEDLPELEHCMDGSGVAIDLSWTNPVTLEAQPAGSVTLQLAYIPSPQTAKSSAEAITATWYFEVTVIGAVFLNMIVLALQSPTAPPPLLLYGVLLVLEIFCATHMVLEFLMELSVHLVAKTKWYHDRWLCLSAVVTVVSWLSIVSPALSVGSVVESLSVVNASSPSMVSLDDAYYRASGAKTVPAARLIAAYMEHLGQGSIANVLTTKTKRTLRKLLSVLRVLRIVRPIRTLRMIKNIDIVITVITETARLLFTVVVLMVFLLSMFTLIGLSSFTGALQYECIDYGEKPVCNAEQQFSADMMRVDCPLPCPRALSCASLHEETWCAPLQGGRRSIGGDRHGFRDYDTFLRGLVATFVQTTGDGGMHSMPLALTASGAVSLDSAWVISFASSVFLNMLCLNLFLAVCCSAYSDVVARTEELELAKERYRDNLRAKIEARTAMGATTATSKISIEAQEDARAHGLSVATAAEEEATRGTTDPIDIKMVDDAADEEAVDGGEARSIVSDLLDQSSPVLSIEERIHDKHWVAEGSRIAGVRERFKILAISLWFERATSVVIICNTFSMALVHEDMDSTLKQQLRICELIFLCIFVTEALIKLCGFGSSIYFSSAENKFDVFVIAASIVGFVGTFYMHELETLLGLEKESLASVQSLRAVRLIRALQVVRLLQRQKALAIVLRTIFKAWRPLAIHSFFCFFSMSGMAIIGMHVFGGSLGTGARIDDYDVETPANLETFGRALLTVFEMTVGEEWSHVMYWYTKYAGMGHGYPHFAVQVFFMLAYVWMNSILFSLCVAMMLENFSVAEEDKVPTQKRMYDRRMREEARRTQVLSVLESTVEESHRIGHVHSEGSSVFDTLDHASHSADLSAFENKSLFVFKLNNPFRLWAAKAQASPLFSHGVMCLILFSCISLAVEGPGEGSTGWVQENLGPALAFINFAVLMSFILEAFLKCVIHGFVLSSGPTTPYLGTRANRLDFFIILLCTISYIDFVPLHGAAARALRVGRVITPMVNLAKNPDIKLVFISFARAGPDTAVVLLPLAILALVFAIIGVATFGSSLKGCATSAEPLVALHANETLCDISPDSVWVSPVFHFDDVPHAMATLFAALTDGAHGIMLKTAEGTPMSGYTFWVAFHLVFTCFFLNLFIGVLSASFEKSSGSSLHSMGEQQWAAVQLNISRFRPRRSETEELGPTRDDRTRCCKVAPYPVLLHKVRLAMFAAATNEKIENCWRFGILLNTMVLATERFPIGADHANFISKCNAAFLGVCTLEVLIKLIGFGPVYYFGHGWMVSDFLLVLISIGFRLFGIQSGVETLRVMRVFRLLVLMAKIPDLASLIETLIRCIKASLALLLITNLIIYLFAIIGMNLFGLLPDTSRLEQSGILSEADEYKERKAETIIASTCPHCSTYTDVTNFSSFFKAFKLLVQSAFGQGIGSFITDMQYLGADFWLLFIYFSAFYGVTVWVCFNLLIVTVLSNFDAAIPQEMNNTLTPEDMDGFAHCWAALTIGTHSCEAVEKSSEGILQRLSATLEKEADDMLRDFEEPKTVEFESGDPDACGTLTIRVEKIDGLGDVDILPYCLITAHSEIVCSEATIETPSQELEKGSAVWPDGGAEFEMHITGKHTHLDFDVRDSFQFSNNRVGGCSVSLDDIRKLCGHGLKKSERQELSDEDRTMTLPLMVDQRVQLSEVHGEADRWDRHVHLQHLAGDGTVLEDPAEEEIVEDDLDGPLAPVAAPGTPANDANGPEIDLSNEETLSMLEENLNKEERRQKKLEEKLRKKEEKRVQKAEKKAAKQARKQAKRDAKAARKHSKREAKAAKKAGNSTQPETEPEVKPNAHRFYVKGWGESGATFRVRFEFKRKVMLTQTTSFVKDFLIRYPTKESNCGVEGWLELSENGGKFHKRFCYVQEYPVPCFKFIKHASTVTALEGLATRAAIELHTIQGEHMLAVADRHEAKSSEEQETLLHVREVGDVCQSEDELRVVFSKFGPFVRAMVRDRADEEGNNTSWALVTMGNPEAAKKALREVVTVRKDGLEKTLNINPFSKKQAAASKGGMKKINAALVGFQLITSEPTGSGKQEEAQIGLISGTVVKATGLKSSEDASQRGRGVPVVQPLSFEELSKEHTEPEKLDGMTMDDDVESVDEGMDVSSDPDEKDQKECEIGRYVAVKGVTVRKHADLQSPEIGVIRRGQIVAVTHTKQLEVGILRLKCAVGGWISASTVSGKVHMVPENAENFYRAISKRPVQVGEFAEVGKCTEAVSVLQKGTVFEALETVTDQTTGQARIRTKHGWISEVDFDISATPDPFCTIDAIPVEGSGTAQAARVTQEVNTQVVDDSLEPQWNHAFDLKVFPSSGDLVFSVRNGERKSEVMGTATVSLVDEAGLPGAVLSGETLSPIRIELGTNPAQVIVELTDADGAPAGAVTLLLAYAPMVGREELLAARDAHGGNLSAAMMVEETTVRTYKFKAMTEEIRRAWLATLRWTATGCASYPATPPAALPPAPILDAEMQRAMRDVSLLALPFRRTTQLLNGLYHRRVMGKHKPKIRYTAYAIFNLETFAWSSGGHTTHKHYPFIGLTLRDMRGLNFHSCLERLCLLHYGKKRCLSYEQQMTEYTTEIQHVSLHMILACVGQWVARKQAGKTIGGEPWPWAKAWRMHPAVYSQAVRGIFYCRLRTLRVLRQEIERNSRPALMGELLPGRERLAPKAGGEQCGCLSGGAGAAGGKQEEATDSSSPRVSAIWDPSGQSRAPTREHFAQIRLEDFKLEEGSNGIDEAALRSALENALAALGGAQRPHETERVVVRALAAARTRALSTEEWVTGVMESLGYYEDDDDSDLDELALGEAELEAALFPAINA